MDSDRTFVNGAWFKGLFTVPGSGEVFPGIPYLLVWSALFGLIFWFLYNKTTHGKYMYALGGNENAAEVSGVNTARTKIPIYVTAVAMDIRKYAAKK